MTKTLTLKFTNYVVKGVADVTCWGGDKGCIDMKPFNVNQKSILENDDLLLKNCNGGGFGVEKINGAMCDIYENYEGTLKYIESKEVGKVSEHTFNYINQVE